MFMLFSLTPDMCPELSDPENGRVELNGTSVGDTATFTCNEGYELDGAQVLTCQEGGNWDNPLPMCKPLAGKKLFLLRSNSAKTNTDHVAHLLEH